MSAPRIMPFDVSAYLADTTHLSNAQHGAYLLILMAMWQHGGAIVDDDEILARVAKLNLDRWHKIAPAVKALLRPVEGGRLTQRRLSSELSKWAERSEKNRASGSIGGVAKSLKSKDPPLANATVSPPHSLEQAKNGHLSLFGELDSESEIEGKKVRKKESNLVTARARGPQPLPDDWQPSFADLAYAVEKGFQKSEAMDMAEAFRNHHHHKGTKGLKWSAGWQLWVRNEIKFSARGGSQSSGRARGHAPGTPADLATRYNRRTP